MADWTTVNPTIVAGTKQITPSGTEIELEFTDDTTPTPNTFIRKFRVRDLADLQEQAFQYQIQLSNTDDVPASGSITPVDPTPTPKEQAILDIQEAARRRAALENFASLFGKAGTDLIGGAGTPTVDARRATLQATIDNNTSSGAHVNNRLLDEWEFQFVDSPGNARTPEWHATNAVVDPAGP